MLPARYNLVLYRGDTLRLQLRFWLNRDRTDPDDLAGVVAASQIRDRVDGASIANLTCVVTLPNIVDASLDSDLTRLLPRCGVWDLQLTYQDGYVYSPIAGSVTAKPDVTQLQTQPFRMVQPQTLRVVRR